MGWLASALAVALAVASPVANAGGGDPWALADAEAAADARANAERERLELEILTLAQRNAWTGVERTFVALDRLGTPISLRAYSLGSQAARTRGDLLAAVDRLERGVAQGTGGDGLAAELVAARDVLTDLGDRYGYLHVTVYAKPARLVRDPIPFSPEEQAAIAFAHERMVRDRAFMGLVPSGRYTLGDLAFTVIAGAPMVEVRVGTPPESGTTAQ